MAQLTGSKMHLKALLLFSLNVVAICGLLWGAELAFPKSIASMIVLIAIVVLGISIARPGWNLRPATFRPSGLVLFSLLLASAAAAAWLLSSFRVPLPYDFSTLKIAAAVPSILLITGIEELLFRQILYQWLKKRRVSSQSTVIATALAFGGAHLGPIFLGSSIGASFYLLQSAYMIWIGFLLGQLRHTTDSWLMPWLGHAGYNIAVLYVFSILLL